MKIVGICKALTCGDFIPAVLDGMYNLVDEIVFLYPERDWNGNVRVNEVASVVRKWKRENDYALKITELNTELINQEEQYNYVIENVCKELKPDWNFIFDTDEVWEESQLQKLFEIAEKTVYENAIYCKMHTYIKSPLYQIEPCEPCMPCVMVRGIPGLFRGVRGNMTRPGIGIDHIKFHHFSYVRNNEREVFEKVKLSTAADGLQTVNVSEWILNKWNMLPDATDFHTTRYAENYWESVRVIDERELPEAVRALPIFKRGVK